MGVIDDFKGASILFKIAFIILALSFIFVYIAISCPGWAVYENDQTKTRSVVGLWRSCTSTSSSWSSCSMLDGAAEDSLAATQAMVVLGFAGTNVAFLLLALAMFSSNHQGSKDCTVGSAVASLVAGVFLLIGCIIFAVNYEDGIGTSGPLFDLSYAFAFGIMAAIFDLVTGVLLLIAGCSGSGTSPSG